MSTSPNEPRFEHHPRFQPSARPLSSDRRSLSPIRGLIWLTVWVGILVLLVMYPELLTDYLWHGIELVLEVAEETLDVTFEMIGLTPPIAQMATAYTGVVVGLALFYLLLRKSMDWTRKTRQTVNDYKGLYTDLSKTWWERQRQKALDWWVTLDWMHRIALMVFLVLVGIPLALLLSFLLGSAVTMFF